ncbi:MAG: hypothetical protein R3C40_09590 [Parvularculaceae bacterium]
MQGFSLPARAFAAIFAVVSLASGCAAVVSPPPGVAQESFAEREALKAAAEDLAVTRWPKPDAVSFTQRLTGFIDTGDRLTRDRVVEIYVKDLAAAGSPAQGVIADAAAHMKKAANVAEVADIASSAPNPRMSDVAVIEQAITDFREIRNIYLAACKKIDMPESDVTALSDELDASLASLGEAADRLADAAVKNRAKAFAGSPYAL